MTNEEKLKKGNTLIEQIKSCKNNIEKAEYMITQIVVERESYLKFNGSDGELEIPSTLFKTIGKLVLSELRQELLTLQKDFNEIFDQPNDKYIIKGSDIMENLCYTKENN